MTAPDPHAPLTRRALREAARGVPASDALPARHARRPRLGVRAWIALAGAVVLVAGGTTAVTAALMATEPPAAATRVGETPEESVAVQVVPLPPEGLPTPEITADAAATTALCDEPALVQALQAGDDGAAVAAAGGAEAFRLAVAAGTAPCLRLDDPAREWVVVNKLRPYAPIDFSPGGSVRPEGVRALEDATLRPQAAAALTALVRAAADAGAGEIAMESAYRSYTTQQRTYSGHVSDRGREGADLVSARPGFSEHQSGLAVDVVPCDGPCRTIDDLAASPQGAWVAEHAWEFGWIVRYESGRTDVTGYDPEPWHLRYIGPELAKAYHDGGFATLEEFFALPPAPAYAG